jgi:signal peptidase I
MTYVRYALFFLAVVVLSTCTQSTLFDVLYVENQSMNPVLEDGNVILVSTFDYNVRTPERVPLTSISFPHYSLATTTPDSGDVIVYKTPKRGTQGRRSLGAHPKWIDSNVKRCIGQPGDTLRYGKDSVHVDGTAFAIRRARYAERNMPQTMFRSNALFRAGLKYLPSSQSYVLHDGYYFLVGDNRKQSVDSRFYGPVHRNSFVGEVFFNFHDFESI